MSKPLTQAFSQVSPEFQRELTVSFIWRACICGFVGPSRLGILQEQLHSAYFTLLCSWSYMAQSSHSGGFNKHSVVTHTVPGAETRVQFTTRRGGRQTIPDTEMGTKNIEVPSCAWE